MSDERLIPLPRLLQAMRLLVRGFGSREAEVEAVVQRLVEAENRKLRIGSSNTTPRAHCQPGVAPDAAGC